MSTKGGRFNPSSSSSSSSSDSRIPRNKGYYWIEREGDEPIPSEAVVGLCDVEGNTVYIGRAKFKNDLLPARVVPVKNCAFVTFEGKEYPKEKYDVLCGNKLKWIPCDGGLPKNAVKCGRTEKGEQLYVGRCDHNGVKALGKVRSSNGALYIYSNGEELKYENFEILVLD